MTAGVCLLAMVLCAAGTEPDVDKDTRQAERMMRWRNVACPESEPDAEMQNIDALEDHLGERLGDMPQNVAQIRALISRIDPLSHYKTFDNLDFILRAIGALDYPKRPAVDVLWRFGEIDEERRLKVKAYIDALTAWIEDKPREEVDVGDAKLVDSVYTSLGERTEWKVWLAMCMAKTLKEHAYTPWDVVDDHGNREYVCAVYETILGRPPSPDDLAFRVKELESGKTREDLFQEVFSSEEHKNAYLERIAGRLKDAQE